MPISMKNKVDFKNLGYQIGFRYDSDSWQNAWDQEFARNEDFRAAISEMLVEDNTGYPVPTSEFFSRQQEFIRGYKIGLIDGAPTAFK